MAKQFYIQLGINMREARLAKGYSQQYIADKMGVSRQTVYYWEKGERVIYADDLFSFCDVVDMDINELVKELRRINK